MSETFIVQTASRGSAALRGTIVSLSRQKEQSFCSLTELIKLINVSLKAPVHKDGAS